MYYKKFQELNQFKKWTWSYKQRAPAAQKIIRRKENNQSWAVGHPQHAAIWHFFAAKKFSPVALAIKLIITHKGKFCSHFSVYQKPRCLAVVCRDVKKLTRAQLWKQSFWLFVRSNTLDKTVSTLKSFRIFQLQYTYSNTALIALYYSILTIFSTVARSRQDFSSHLTKHSVVW